MGFRLKDFLLDLAKGPYVIDKSEGEIDAAEKSWIYFKRVLYWIYISVWIGAVMYTVFNISQSLNTYLDKPVRTKVTVDRSSHGTMVFPTISICNNNRISKDFLDKNPIIKRLTNNIQRSGSINWTDPDILPYIGLTYKDLYRFTTNWEDTAIMCTHAGVRYCSQLQNRTEDIMQEDYGPTGKCFRFNPNGAIRSKTGDYGAIYLRLNVNRRDYSDPSDEVIFHVAIHHHTQYSVTRNTGIQISPGFKYKIGVRPTERIELDISQGGRCNKSLKTNSYGAYDLESCHMECRDRILNSKCGCVIWQPPIDTEKYKTCNLKEINECGFPEYVKFVMEESDPMVAANPDCYTCPVPCENTVYSLQTTTTALSREWAYQKYLKEGKRFNYTVDDFLNNFVVMEVYFTDMYIDKIQQIPAYNFWNLLADVGGFMGLFLGASIFTLIELVTKMGKNVYKYSKSSDNK